MSGTDDREYPEGLSNDARLMRWVRDHVPDTRVRMGGTEPVTMTGGELFDLLYEVTDWAYRNGTADVAHIWLPPELRGIDGRDLHRRNRRKLWRSCERTRTYEAGPARPAVDELA